MADEKLRNKIHRESYCVLVSFKDGATPAQLETRTDETLGYSFAGQYIKAGFRDVRDMLKQHPNIRETADGKYKIVANADVEDIAALVSKQKDGKRKKGGKKGQRPATSAGFRNGFGGGATLRNSPKGMHSYRPMNLKSNHFKTQQRSSTSASFYQPKNFGNQSFGNASFSAYQNPPKPFRAPSSIAVFPTTTQRPLSRPTVSFPASLSNSTTQSSSSTSRRISAPSPAPSDRVSQFSETVKPATRACQMPSIKEFSDNSKKMMQKMHPRTIHLSDMSELYSQEYGVFVEPLQVFSKSWKMLITTTFKDWLEIVDCHVGLKKEWVQKYGNGNSMPENRSLPKAGPAVRAASAIQLNPPALQVNSKEDLPTLQGFRYQPPKSPTDAVVKKMRGLSVGSRHVLKTPEKPPGLVRETNLFPKNLKPVFSKSGRPKTSMLSSSSNFAANGMRPMTASAVRFKNELKPINEISLITVDNSSVPKTTSKTVPTQPAPPLPQTSSIPTRSNLSACPSSRLFGRALADVKKQGDDAPPARRAETATQPFYVSSTATPLSKVHEPKMEAVQKPTVEAPVADEWDDPAVAIRPDEGRAMSVISSTRSSNLPPMSKGSRLPMPPPSVRRSVSSSIASSHGCSDQVKEALRCELPDSGEWE